VIFCYISNYISKKSCKIGSVKELLEGSVHITSAKCTFSHTYTNLLSSQGGKGILKKSFHDKITKQDGGQALCEAHAVLPVGAMI